MAIPKIGRGFGGVLDEKPIEAGQSITVPVVYQEVPSPPQLPSLDEAAEVLAKMLPPDTLLFIREASDSLKAPLWQMLCGYTMNCADRMQLFTPHLMSAWTIGEGATRERKCESCGLEFGSSTPDARFCCDRCYFEKLSELGHSENCPTKQAVA
mgnify:CR=1 FL=1